jgi:hypothetical protein
MKKPILVTDVDFVLLDWCAGLVPFLKEKGMEHKHIEKYIGSTYYPRLEELFLESDENVNIMIMKEFNNSKWIEHLPMFQKDAKNYQKNLTL